jgi:hypothetical protein
MFNQHSVIRIYAALYFAGWSSAQRESIMLTAGISPMAINIAKDWASRNNFNVRAEISDGNG